MKRWIGLDIGGTTIKAGRVVDTGVVEALAERPSPPDRNGFREALQSLFSELDAPSCAGAGIGCRGIIDPSTSRVVISPGSLRYLDGCRLSGLLPFAGPVIADNDARAALAGEVLWGAGRGHADVVMLTVGTGVGGGVLSGGRLLRGSTGAAGHLGHLNVDPNGPLCVCGARGCLETYVSAKALEAVAFASVHRGLATALRDTGTDCESVFACAAREDAVAAGLLREFFARLGGAVAGLIFAFDPEFVIVGGRVSRAGESFFTPLQAEVNRRIRPFFGRDVRVVPPACGEGSGVAGAAALVALYNENC